MADQWQSTDDHAPAAEQWQSLDDVAPKLAKPTLPPSAYPGAARPPIPEDLKTDAQVDAENRASGSYTFINPRTGRKSYSDPVGSGGILDSPVTGPQKVIAGVENLATPAAFAFPNAPGADAAMKATYKERVQLPLTADQFKNDLPASTRPVNGSDILKQAAEGTHQIIGGAFETMTPALVASGIVNPSTVLKVGAAMAGQGAVEKGLTALGLDPAYSALFGDAAGLGAVIAAGSLMDAAKRAILKSWAKPYLQAEVNARYAERVAREQAANAPKQIGAPPDAAPAAQDIPYGDAPPDQALPSGQPQPRLGPDTRPQRQLGGATPGQPGPIYKMPGEVQPGEPIPAGPAYGAQKQLPPGPDPTPFVRVQQGVTRIQDLSQPDLIDFLKDVSGRLQTAAQPQPNAPAPPEEAAPPMAGPVESAPPQAAAPGALAPSPAPQPSLAASPQLPDAPGARQWQSTDDHAPAAQDASTQSPKTMEEALVRLDELEQERRAKGIGPEPAAGKSNRAREAAQERYMRSTLGRNQPEPIAQPTEEASQAEVQNRALRMVGEKPEELLDAYTKRFGNVLNADNAAELFPDYSKSRESRTQFRTAVHPAAQWVRDELFQRALGDPGVNEVVFTAGGTGAGKSAGSLSGDVVLDSTLSNPEHSRSEIQNALNAGKRVQIVYTHRPIEEAMAAALDRAKENGRTVPINTMIQTHAGAAKTVAALFDQYRDNPRVRFRFVDNSAGHAQPGTIDLTRKQDYSGKGEALHAILESRRSDLPDDIYQTAKGAGHGRTGGRTTAAGTPQPSSTLSQKTSSAASADAQVAAPKPGTNVDQFPVSSIHADPVRFQFKRDVGQGGAGEKLKSVKVWNPDMAGRTSVWHDPADSKTYIINGHHRLDLAKRLGVPGLDIRYIDAKDAKEARSKGAMLNIGEVQGTSLDAAKLFRDTAITPADLEKYGVAVNGRIAKEGVALSRLAAPIFEKVLSGELSIKRGATIGEALESHADQQAVLDLADKAERGGKHLRDAELGELVRRVSSAERIHEKVQTLFGEDEKTQNLALEETRVSAYVRQRLGADKKLFQTVSTQSAAERLSKAGNVVQTEGNARIAAEATEAQAIYDKLSLRAGPIDTAIRSAARSIAKGAPEHEVREQAYSNIRKALSETLRGSKGSLPRRSEAGNQGRSSAAVESVRNPAASTPEVTSPQFKVLGSSPEAILEDPQFARFAQDPNRKRAQREAAGDLFRLGEELDEARKRGVAPLEIAHRQQTLVQLLRSDFPEVAIEESDRGPLSVADFAEQAAQAHEAHKRGNDTQLARDALQKELDHGKTVSHADLEDSPLFGGRQKGLWGDESGSISVDLATLGLSKFIRDDIAPNLRAAITVMKHARGDILKIFAPAARGVAANLTAQSVRANAAALARSTDRASAALHVAKVYFDKQPKEDNYEFMDSIESGTAQENADLGGIAATMRTMLDTRREAIRALGTGKLNKFIENYFPHIWKDPQAAEDFYANVGKRPIEGSKAFTKKRTIDTIASGLQYGLEPVSDNPVDLVLLKCREMDKYIMAHSILNELKDQGVARYKDVFDQMPPGYKQVDDRIATVYGRPEVDAHGKPVGGLVTNGHFIMPEPAALVLNNYLSPGLRERSGLFRAYMGAANLMNQAQLGWSAFHFVFTGVDALNSRAALGVYQAAKGSPVKGALSILSTPIAPIQNVITGHQMMKEWKQAGASPAMAAMVDAMVQAGGRAGMSDFFQTHVTKAMIAAFRGGNWWGAAIRAPFALTEQAARPILEYWVPRLKMGVFGDLAKFEVERLGPDADQEEVRAALGRAWDSVDNRLGQLVYDNLFWHKVLKDLAMGSVRSVGWDIGLPREVIGGAVDAAKLAAGKGDFTPRMSYTIAAPFVLGLMGATLYYLWHGEAPKELKDYYFPTDSHGQRWSLPSYAKDAYSYAHAPLHTMAGKRQPLLSVVWEMLNNEDYFKKPIMNKDDSLVVRAGEMAAFAIKQFEPISATTIERNKNKGVEQSILPFVGITPAPKAIDTPYIPHQRQPRAPRRADY